jgi:hypothetical protein
MRQAERDVSIVLAKKENLLVVEDLPVKKVVHQAIAVGLLNPRKVDLLAKEVGLQNPRKVVHQAKEVDLLNQREVVHQERASKSNRDSSNRISRGPSSRLKKTIDVRRSRPGRMTGVRRLMLDKMQSRPSKIRDANRNGIDKISSRLSRINAVQISRLTETISKLRKSRDAPINSLIEIKDNVIREANKISAKLKKRHPRFSIKDPNNNSPLLSANLPNKSSSHTLSLNNSNRDQPRGNSNSNRSRDNRSSSNISQHHLNHPSSQSNRRNGRMKKTLQCLLPWPLYSDLNSRTLTSLAVLTPEQHRHRSLPATHHQP